jgi:hypothetical protein
MNFDLANQLKMRPGDITKASVDEVRSYYASKIDPVVLEVATQDSIMTKFWRVGAKYYFDDPEYGEPVAIDDLRYNKTLGLHTIDELD